MDQWNAQQYLKYEDERTRPAGDLLAQVPLTDVRRAIDLGCGPGNSTELLVHRNPGAIVSGIDWSADMLLQARRRLPQCNFMEWDLADWTSTEPVNLVFANAAYQWVPGHLTAIARVLGKLDAGSVLAIQMPDNTREPSHIAMETVARRFGIAEAARADLPEVATYYDVLKPRCAHIEIWHTIYHHALAGPAAIAEWFRGSALRPFLSGLEPEREQEFVSAYLDEIKPRYPERVDGSVLLRFPRLFIVATR